MTLPALISFVDRDQRYVLANPAYQDWFGIAPEKIIGMNITEVLGEEAYGRRRHQIVAALQGKTVMFEVMTHHPEMGQRATQLIYTPGRGADGLVQGFFAVGYDVTEYKEHAEALRKNEALLHAAQSLAHVGGWELDLQDRQNLNNNTLHWTDETFRIFGYEPGEVVVTNALFLEHVHPDDREELAEKVQAAVRDKKPYEMLHRILLPDRKERIIQEWADIATDPRGRPLQMLGACQDVTEHKKAEEALHEANARLRLMLESIKDYAIFTLDTRGHITSWNPGAEKIFGFSAEEAIGQSGTFIFTPEDREHKMPEREMLVAKEKGRAEDERWHVRNSGEQFFASGIMASIRDDSNHLLGFVKIARDITRQKETEAALIEARNKANEANRAKSEFLANMSHEIRTPMNAVVGLAHILSMTENLPEKQQEIVKTLQLSAQSLMGLINDLLDISKIETNKVELENIPFNLMDIIREVCSVLSPKADEKHITLECADGFSGNRLFLGDPLRIRQILMNLVSNAIKFTETGGVTIAVSSTPHPRPGYMHTHIAVTDTGIGIAADKLESVFDKFIQADTSTTRKYGGSGLGLTISRSLAEIMSGNITVKSRPGKGSEFTLHLPLQITGDEQSRRPPARESSERKSARNFRPCILLVEDYGPNILVARLLLEKLGYDVAIARNGKEALIKIRAARHRYAAVLMDIQMPEMDGFEVTRLIREEERVKGLPRLRIIAMTAHALRGDRERCLKAGMDRYIPKPFQSEELRKVLDQLNVRKGMTVALGKKP